MKILVAGLGSIGQRHARNLRTLLGDELDLLGYRVRRASPVLGDDLAVQPGEIEDAYGIRSFGDLDEALAERPDAVFVTNPNTFHVPVALAAARAGAHVFVEKPLSHSLDGVDELEREVASRRLVCMVGYQLRFHPALDLLREFAANEPVAAARFESGENLADMHPYEDYRGLNYGRADQGGGAILMLSHDLDVACSLFGVPSAVFARGGKQSELEIDVEDTATMLLECGGVSVRVHQDFVRRPPVRRYELAGESATLVWDHVAGTVTTSPGGTVDVSLDRNALFLEELRHFLACIESGAQPLVGLREAGDTLRVALAAKRSLASGEPVAP